MHPDTETPLMLLTARLQRRVPALQRLWHFVWRCEVRRIVRRDMRR